MNTTIDNTLHLVSDITRTLDVDGEAVPVREWEVRGLVTEREFMPILERRGNGPVLYIDWSSCPVSGTTPTRRLWWGKRPTGRRHWMAGWWQSSVVESGDSGSVEP